MRVRWAAIAALVLALVVAAPASATYVQTSHAVKEGQIVTVNCPQGERLWSGTAYFYRQQSGAHGSSKPMATVPLTPTADGLGGMATAPKGARWVYVDVWCANTVQVQQNTGSTADYVYFYCPPDAPYLTSLVWPSVVADRDGDFSTTNDQFSPDYISANFGEGSIYAGPVDPGVYVRVAFTCSSTSV